MVANFKTFKQACMKLLKIKRISYKNTFNTTSLFKKIKLYVWRFEQWASTV
jgi:hypothetical protein